MRSSASSKGYVLMVKTTAYYRRRSRDAARTYLTDTLVERVLINPERLEVQENGRIRHWARIDELGGRALRVVTLEDGETVHNAFIDRGYRAESENP